MQKIDRSQLQPYAVTVLAVVIALLLTRVLQPLLAPTIFVLFFPAVMVSALYGGMEPGLVATILSTLVCKYFFLAPVYSLTIPDLGTGVRLVVFLLVTLLFTIISSALRSQRRRTEMSLYKLRASEERYRVLAETVPQLVWIARADGYVEYFNQRWFDYTGLKLDETHRWDWQRVIHPEDLPSTLEQWTRGLATGNRMEVHYRLKRTDGVYRWHIMRAVPLRGPNGEIVNWFGTCTDIHDQKQTEEVLHQREQERIQLLEELESKQRLLEAVLQQMPAGLMVAEAPSGRLVLMNEQVQQILHSPFRFVDRVENYIQYQLFYPDGRLYTPEETPLARSLLTGEVVTAEELDIACGDGTRRTLLASSTPIRHVEGQILAAVLTFYDITERKQARERIQLYADVVKNIQVGLVVWQLENLEQPGSFRLITANSAANQLTGVDFDALIGTTMAQSFPALLDTQLLLDYAEVVRTGQPKDLGEVRYGDERVAKGIFSLKAFPLPNRCLGLAFESITKRKKVEEALQDALQKLNFHVENTPLAVIERDRDFRITRWSREAERIFGWQAEEVIGKGIDEWQSIFQEDIKLVNDARARLLSGEEKHNSCRNRSYRKDGSLIHCEWYNSALLDESGNLVSVLSLILDVSDRKLAEEALLKSEERFRIAQEISLDAFTILLSVRDAAGKIVDFEWEYVNPKGAEILRRSVEDLKGLRLLQIFPGHKTNSELFDRYVQVVETGIPHDIEIPYNSDGMTGWFRNMAVKLDDGVAISFSDITKRKEAEVERINLLEREKAARAQAETANRIKDEFLAVLSHELRSPLNPILGWTKLLQSRKFDEATTARALETIERNAKLQIQLIEDLLDVSRILRGKLSLNVCPVNLVTTIEAALETVHLAASAKSIEIKTVYEPNVGQILGDSGRLQQVVWNLLSNAVKFTPSGGRVEVRLSGGKGLKVDKLNVESWEDNLQPSTLQPSTLQPSNLQPSNLQPSNLQPSNLQPSNLQPSNLQPSNLQPSTLQPSTLQPSNLQPSNLQLSTLQPSTSYAQIQVSDTGKGINPDFLPYVFDYFRQENSTTTRLFGGLGLGLAIVRHLVELHGGRVCAESPGEGQGATFTVWLPLMQTQEKTNQESRQSNDSPDLSGIRILVVDDEADMREFLAVMLEDYGAQVKVVSSAGEALEALTQVKPDILLSDIGMPEVDGYMLIRQIRAMPPEQGGKVPAIALTAYAGEADQTQAIAAGFIKHVAKPIEPAELARLVASLARGNRNR